MSNPHEHDGTHEAVEQFVKEGVGLAIQLVAHYKRQANLADQQQLRDGRDEKMHQLLEGLQARDTLNKAVASTRWQGVHNEQWWQERLNTPEGASEIVETYKDALTYADQDQSATDAVNAMNERFTQAPFNFNVADLMQDGYAASVPDEEAAKAFAEHLGKDPSQLHVDFGDLPDLVDATGVEPHVTEVIASLKDLQLSQALTTVGSPFSAAETVQAAIDEEDVPQARPEHGVRDQSRSRDQGL